MASIKAGVIGLGFIAPAHVEALRRLGDVEVVAVAGARHGTAEAKAAQLGVPRAYADWRDLVADPDVQVVHNCTPNFLHYEVNMAAIEAGKAIVCEKPLAMDAQQAAELLRAVKAAGVIHAVCLNNRMYPLTQEMKARVARGDIGEVRLVHGAYLQDWLLYETDYNWRIDPAMGGAARTVGDIGTHWLDLAQFVTGLKIAAVYADLVTFLPRRRKPKAHVDAFAGLGLKPEEYEEVEVTTEDCGLILLRFENGARGACVLSQMCAGRKNYLTLEVYGARGSLAWNLERPNELWLGHRDRPNELLPKDPVLLAPAARACAHYPGYHNEGYPDTFKNLFREVYAAVREGGKMPDNPTWPTFEAGYRANLVVDAILRSTEEQRWVAVAFDKS
ncbi:MAG TPA: Gfo/Idh/MocA family oxidoreductase [Anaerolineae bacterium]|nr:Gfo/Idh/MocA family oxidoreductase [Anaerolineae bacterium]